MTMPAGGGVDTPEVGDPAEGVEGSEVTGPEANNWWQFGSKDQAEQWANDLITKRLSRHKKAVVDPIQTERDTLKAEVERLRPLEDASKTDVQRFEDRLNAVLPELESLRSFKADTTRSELVRSIAEELGIPAKFTGRIRGDDEDAIRADATELLNVLSEGGSDTKKVPVTKAPKESNGGDKNRGGGGSDEESDDSLIADILGQVSKDRAKGGLTTRR